MTALYRSQCCAWLLALFALGCADNTPADVKVLDYGIYDAVLVTSGSVALGQDLVIEYVSGLTHRETTTTIPRETNTYFGVRLDPKTLPSRFKLRIEFEHPTFSKDGQKATEPVTVTVTEVEVKVRGDFDGAALWYFLEGMEYEMVPGKWVFRVLIDQHLVANQEFIVGM